MSTLNSIVGIIYVSKEIYLSSTYTEPPEPSDPSGNWAYLTIKPMNDSNTTDYPIYMYPPEDDYYDGNTRRSVLPVM